MTPKQERFVQEYLKDLNATQAAIRAGYSEKTAEQQGPRLLGNVEVAAAIAERKEERAERVKVDADWVLERLKREAELEYDQGGTQAGRVAALNLIAKHTGGFDPTVKVEKVESVKITLVIDDPKPRSDDPALPPAV